MRTAIGCLLMILILARYSSSAQDPVTASRQFDRHSQGFDPWVKQDIGLLNRHAGCMMHVVDTSTFWSVFEAWEESSQECIRTTNGGASWLCDTVHGAPSTYKAVSIYAFDAKRAWVLMWNRVSQSGGGLFRTTDGGATWNQDATVFKKAVDGIYGPNFIYFFDAKNGVCVGDSNDVFEIYTTSDGGDNWSQVPRARIPTKLTGEFGLTHVFTAAGNSLWFPTLVNPRVRFIRTTDKGLTWNAWDYPKPRFGSFPTIEFQDEQVGLCNSGWGDVEKTTNGGMTWTTIPTSMQLAFQDLKYVPHTAGMYIASAFWRDSSLVESFQYGTLYTLDAGVHWTIATAATAMNKPADLGLPRFRFASPTSGWQGDMSQNIYKWSVPTGQFIGVHPDSLVFSRLNLGDSSEAVVVDFVNHGTDPVTLSGIVMPGGEFTVMKQPTLPTTLPSLGAVRVELSFTPRTDGAHRDSLVFVSNASNAPRKAVCLQGRAGSSLEPARPGIMYAVGTSLYSLNTTTGTPSMIGSLSSVQLRGLAVHPLTGELYGATMSNSPTTLYRVCCASAYVVIAQKFPVANMRAIAFSPNGVLYGASTAGRLYRLDLATGDTIGIGTAPEVAYASIAFSPSGKLWAADLLGIDKIYTVDITTGVATLVGSTGDYLYTTAIVASPTGTLYGLKGTGSETNAVITIDTLSGEGTTLFSLGMAGINSIAMMSFPTGVDEPEGPLPKVFAMLQNYPNPFNPSTTIRYNLPTRSHVRLTVFNTLGQQVAELVNGEINPGYHEVMFDGRNLASGVYLYRIQVRPLGSAIGRDSKSGAEGFVRTMKLLLLR